MTSPCNPERTVADNLAILRQDPKKIHLVNTGPRDTGQSDYKNRHTSTDLLSLAPLYEEAGFFAVEMHGGARFHQDLMHNKIDPFVEARAWKDKLTNSFTQTLIRSTNAFGYRAYPANVIRRTVAAMLPTIDIWRCFDFLNHIPNMIHIGEQVMTGGKIFEPAISFTDSKNRTDAYYLETIAEIVATFGGTGQIILAIKDMAGTGSPARISQLIDAAKQRWPELVIDYHRHSTDGLGLPALVAAAKAGATILDVTDDAFSRFYGQPPVRAVTALLREAGLEPQINEPAMNAANERVREFIHHYEPFESPFKGFSYDVVSHRMPGGAFPSSFEQAEKGGFLALMPAILRGMSCGNRFIRYFDVTPGSQITWTTWAAIIQRTDKEEGEKGIARLLDTLDRFVTADQDFAGLDPADQEIMLGLYSHATDDLKNLLLGAYGPLPFGWPADWVYLSTFGDNWQEIVDKDRTSTSPARTLPDEDLDLAVKKLEAEIGYTPTEEELILYLQHPQATIDFIKFREKYGDVTALPTQVWFHGLQSEGDTVDFILQGKPQKLELVSVGKVGPDGIRHIVLSVNNTMMVFKVEMPEAGTTKKEVSMAADNTPGQIGATVAGNLWRIGNRDRTLEVGDFVHAGEEVANLEVMKTENAVLTDISGTVTELVTQKNETVTVGQLLLVISPGEGPETTFDKVEK